MNTKETTYVVSVLHIGVCYINAEGSVFSCELREGVWIPKKPRMLSVCCTLVCIINFFYAQGSVFSCELSGTGEGVWITMHVSAYAVV